MTEDNEENNEQQPVKFTGWKADLERGLYRWGFPSLARFMGRWDERSLKK